MKNKVQGLRLFTHSTEIVSVHARYLEVTRMLKASLFTVFAMKRHDNPFDPATVSYPVTLSSSLMTNLPRAAFIFGSCNYGWFLS